MNVTKKIAGDAAALIMCFLLFTALTCACICLVIKHTWLNRDYLNDCFEQGGYYDKIYETVLDAYENIGIPSGVPVEIFEAVLSKGSVRDEIEMSVINMYANKKSDTVANQLTDDLFDAFMSYADSIQAEVGDGAELLELAEYCGEIYADTVAFPFGDIISPVIVKAKSAVDIILPTVMGLSAMCITAIILFLKKRSLARIGLSFIGSGFACLLPGAIILAQAPYKLLNIASVMFFDSFVIFIETSLRCIIYAGTGVLAAGIIMALVGIFMNQNNVETKV